MAGSLQSLHKSVKGRRLFSVGIFSPTETFGFAVFFGLGAIYELLSPDHLAQGLGLIGLVVTGLFLSMRHAVHEEGIQLYPTWVWRTRWIPWKEIEKLRLVTDWSTKDLHDEIVFDAYSGKVRFRLNSESMRLAELIQGRVPDAKVSRSIRRLITNKAKNWATRSARRSDFSTVAMFIVGMPVSFLILFFLLKRSANGWDLPAWVLFVVFLASFLLSSYLCERIWDLTHRQKR